MFGSYNLIAVMIVLISFSVGFTGTFLRKNSLFLTGYEKCAENKYLQDNMRQMDLEHLLQRVILTDCEL